MHVHARTSAHVWPLNAGLQVEDVAGDLAWQSMRLIVGAHLASMQWHDSNLIQQAQSAALSFCSLPSTSGSHKRPLSVCCQAQVVYTSTLRNPKLQAVLAKTFAVSRRKPMTWLSICRV